MFNLRSFWRGRRDLRIVRRARLTAQAEGCQVGGGVRRPAQAAFACLPSNPFNIRPEEMPPRRQTPSWGYGAEEGI